MANAGSGPACLMPSGADARAAHVHRPAATTPGATRTPSAHPVSQRRLRACAACTPGSGAPAYSGRQACDAGSSARPRDTSRSAAIASASPPTAIRSAFHPSSRTRPASSTASRVFPTPPGPVTSRSRAPSSSSHQATKAASSSSRPAKSTTSRCGSSSRAKLLGRACSNVPCHASCRAPCAYRVTHQRRGSTGDRADHSARSSPPATGKGVGKYGASTG